MSKSGASFIFVCFWSITTFVGSEPGELGVVSRDWQKQGNREKLSVRVEKQGLRDSSNITGHSNRISFRKLITQFLTLVHILLAVKKVPAKDGKLLQNKFLIKQTVLSVCLPNLTRQNEAQRGRHHWRYCFFDISRLHARISSRSIRGHWHWRHHTRRVHCIEFESISHFLAVDHGDTNLVFDFPFWSMGNMWFEATPSSGVRNADTKHNRDYM